MSRGLRVELHLLAGLRLAALERGLDERQRELHVAVAHQREIRGLLAQRRLGDVGRQHVLPHRVADRPVEQRDARALAVRLEVREHLELVGRQHAARPARGDAGVRGELVDVEHARDDEIVVAAQADRRCARATSARHSLGRPP